MVEVTFGWESVGTGLLSMFIPPYFLYFAFAKYVSPRKGLIIGSWLGAAALAGGFYGVGIAQAASELTTQLNEELGSTDWDAALTEAAKSNE